MEKATRDVAIETKQDEGQDLGKEPRPLMELELLLVGGGGDEPPNW